MTGLLGRGLLIVEQHLEKVMWFYGKNDFQALVSKCWVSSGTSVITLIIILQKPIVPSDFEDLAGEILRVSAIYHMHRHPIKHL